jgi:hypothetical protein
MRPMILALLLAAPLAAQSQDHTHRCGQAVIAVGDPVTKLRRCGEPWRIVQLETRQGGAAGERWEFEAGRGVVLITVHGGRVVQIVRR